VADLAVHRITNLIVGAALGNLLSGLLRNMPQLQRWDCESNHLCAEGVRSFQPVLRTNRTLRKLNLSRCQVDDFGIRLIADALVGNTTMDTLDVSLNLIIDVGLADITHMIEPTQLKMIRLFYNPGLFNNRDATQQFVSTLEQKKSRVQELPIIDEYELYADNSYISMFASIQNS
jgi:Leucine Rich repeat